MEQLQDIVRETQKLLGLLLGFQEMETTKISTDILHIKSRRQFHFYFYFSFSPMENFVVQPP